MMKEMNDLVDEIFEVVEEWMIKLGKLRSSNSRVVTKNDSTNPLLQELGDGVPKILIRPSTSIPFLFELSTIYRPGFSTPSSPASEPDLSWNSCP
jgi:hypothetical protein